MEYWGEVEAGRFPVVHCPGNVEAFGLADGLLECPETKAGEDLADLLSYKLEEVDDEFGPTSELLAQLGVLGRYSYRTGVQVADPHHHATQDDQWRCGKSEFIGSEQSRHDNVAARLELSVDLYDDAIPQVVEEQGLLGLG